MLGQPVDPSYVLIDLHGSQGVELLNVRLKLSEVLKRLIFALGTFFLKDDDSASLIPQCEMSAGVVVFDGGDDVLFQNLLARPFVAEELGLFVVGSFAWAVLFHLSSIYYTY